MMTFPDAHNPENLPPPAPGYRYLGKDERWTLDDEIIVAGKWTTCRRHGWNDSDLREWASKTSITFRRALSVDDTHAPSPSHWCNPSWVMVTKPSYERPPDLSMQYWIDGRWKQCDETCAFSHHFYYRRPIVTYSNTSIPDISSPGTVPEWIPFSVRGPSTHHLPVWAYSPHSLRLHTTFGEVDQFKGDTHWGSAHIKLPTPPKPTLPPAPMLDGVDGKPYEMLYIKGQDIVSFGCAQIAVTLLKTALSIMRDRKGDQGILVSGAEVSWLGNRTVNSITLDSGVPINHAEIREILAYVEAVNKS